MTKLRTVPILSLLFLLLFGSLAIAGTLVDPIANPGGFVDQFLGTVHANVWLAVGLALFGLLEVAAWAGRTFPNVCAFEWFGTGRVALVIAGAVAVLGAGLQAYLGNGDFRGAIIAAIVAASVYWHPKAGAVALEKTAVKVKRAVSAGVVRRGVMFTMAIVSLGGALVIACGAQQKKALADFGTCSESAGWKELKPTVENILKSGVSNWKQQLEALAASFGEDEIGCAVVAASEAFSSKLGAGSGDASTAAAKARADEYLREHSHVGASRELPRSSKSVAIMWLGPPATGCESPRERPAVDCKPFATEVYDGCHWTCEEQ